MGDLFDIGKAGISAYKSSLAATGQNIANVGTEGYARRDASIEEISTANADVLSISNTSGLGVRMGGITRAFDQFLDLQLQNSSSSFSFSKSKSEVLERLENVLIPKTATVGTRFREFFDGVSNLAQDPSDTNLRTLVLSGAEAVSREISTLHSGLSDLRKLTQDTLELAAGEFNNTLKNLSELQNEILGNSIKSGAPNILLDQRDNLLSKLSEFADISVEYHNNGGLEVSLGQLGEVGTLLKDNSFNKISFELDNQSVKAYLTGASGARTSVHFSSGQLAGLVSADSLTKSTIAEVDGLAKKFVEEQNSIHRMGLDLDGIRGTDLFSLDTVAITQGATNTGSSSLRVEGYSENFSGSELEMIFNEKSKSWSVTSSSGSSVENFSSRLNLDGLSVLVQGQPKDGDKFTLGLSNSSASNMRVLVSDAGKLAAAGLHSIEEGVKNSGSSELKVGYFSEDFLSDTSNLESLFTETRNSANPIKFNSTGALGIVKGVDSIQELSILKSQSNLSFSTDIDALRATNSLTVTLGADTFVFDISNLAPNLDTPNNLAEALNSGSILSNTTSKSFTDLGLQSVATETSFVIGSASQPASTDFAELKAGNLGAVSGMLVAQDNSASDLSVFTREGIQISGKILSSEEVTNLITIENGFTTEANYIARYLPTESSQGFAGAAVDRKTTDGLDIVTLSGAGLDDGIDNNISIYAANTFPETRTQLTSPVIVATSNGQSISVGFESGMMAGQIAEQLSKDLGRLGMGVTASNFVELSGISDGLVEFELFGNNLEGLHVSASITNGSQAELVDKINSFSDVTGIRSHLAGDSTVILEHNDAGDISLKQFNLPNGVGLSVNQLNQDGDRLLATSKTLSGGDSLVAGGHVQIKSTSDFSASYDGNSQNSENAAFEMGFADKKFDLANDFTDINFYANHQLDGGYADAKHLNAVASSSKYSLDLVDSAFGTLGSDFRPKTSEDFSSSKIARGLVSDLRNSATSTVFHGDEFILANGFPLDGSNIDFTLGDQKYVVTLNITDTFEIRANDVKIGNEVFSLTEGLAELAARSTFSISGPEDDRLSAQFEATANGVRLNVAANSGVVSGHSLLVSSTNSDAEKTNFHVSNTSTTELFSNNFVETTGTNADIASVIIDKTEYVIAFDTTTNGFSTTPGLPAAVTLSAVTNPLDTTKIQLKVSVTANSASESIRLKANANSAAYGISTVSAQLLVTEEGLRIFNVGDQRVKSSVAVNSLASEVLSISGLQGEDLIFVANGARNPSAIGKVATTTEKAAREYSLVVNETDPSNIDIYDFSTGHIVGSRSIANDNSAVFQGLSIDFKGTTTGGDRYNVLISGANADDASNLNNMLETSFLNKETGVGGYSELFGKIVSNTGSEIQANQQTLETTEAAYQLALDNKSEFTGVDLDTEAARLMEQQQAYQALARVLSTARELLDTLLRSM